MSYPRLSLRPPRGSKEVELERQQIEDEYALLASTPKSVIRAVNRQRLNALAPISYLPLESLSYIFYLLVDDEKPQMQDLDEGYFCVDVSRKEPRLGWIVVTYVCSHWRRVAVENCSLWRYPLLTWDLNWIQTFLSRCQSAPLSILHDEHDDDACEGFTAILSSAVIQSIHDHLFHIQDLHIGGVRQTVDSLFSGLVKAAPLLRSATFAVHSSDPSQKDVSRIPRNLFDGNAPNLTELILTNCVVPWDSPSLRHIIRNITLLIITFPDCDELWSSEDPHTPILRHDTLPSIAQLFDVLAAASCLKALFLDGGLPNCSPQAHPSSHEMRVASLPHLGIYQLIGNAFDCAAISRHIYAGPRTRLTFVCTIHGGEIEAELSAVAAALKDHVSRCDQSPTFFEYICLQTWPDCLSIASNSYSIEMPSQVDTMFQLAGFLRTCLALWPVSTPTLLIIDERLAFTKRDIIRIFEVETLHCIDRVELESVNVQEFVNALHEQTELSDFRVLPGLQDISFKSARLDKSTLLSIHDGVALRKRAGRPIQNLRMEECSGMSRVWSEKLESELGVKLSCDEFTQEQSIP